MCTGSRPKDLFKLCTEGGLLKPYVLKVHSASRHVSLSLKASRFKGNPPSEKEEDEEEEAEEEEGRGSDGEEVNGVGTVVAFVGRRIFSRSVYVMVCFS